MDILHLTLKKKWFDMILSGEKKEEYREVKPYWTKRLQGKKFDIIRFTNGYGTHAPTFDVELKSVVVSQGHKEWGCDDVCFVLRLGKILQTKNIIS